MAIVSDAELLRLVEQHCTIDDIKALLRQAKARSETPAKVLITAEDKPTLVNSNLQSALGGGAITRDEVLRLVRDAEENGDQHIFYFQPKASKTVAAKMALEQVATAFLGAQWRTRVPSVEVRQGEYLLADVRAVEPAKLDWIVKLYGLDLVTRHGAIRVIEGQRYIPIHENPIRVILVARWRAPNLLEFRVPRDESRRRIMNWVNVLWGKMGHGGVVQNDFRPWDLGTVRRNLLDRETKDSKEPAVYSTRDTRLFDPEHDARASFEGHVEAYDLLDVIEHHLAVERLLKAGNICTHLGIKWLHNEKRAVPSREVHTILMGERAPNEVVIAGHCQPTDVDYITGQLRKFSR